MHDPELSDEMFSPGQAFCTPIMRIEQMHLWVSLLREKTGVENISLNTAVRSNGKDCFVLGYKDATAELLWRGLEELAPTFSALWRHSFLTELSDQNPDEYFFH